MPRPDSATIDAAIVTRLAADPALKAAMPDGVYMDEAPPNLKNFVIVSLFDETDLATFTIRAIEDALYLVKAVSFGTSGTAAKTAAARIDELLENTPLVVADYGWMTTHRERRIRDVEPDAIDASLRWQHRGGFYRVQMTPAWA